MVIALYGDSCVGKTAVARRVGQLLGYEVRHCGELIKVRSAALGCTGDALPTAEHCKLDDETRQIASAASVNIVVEGSFLNSVLRERTNVALIRLICSPRERRRRYLLRRGGGSLESRDGKDLRIRRELYGAQQNREPDLEIDTSAASAVDVAERIVAWVKDHRI
jgi:cytidylate kinase